LTVYVRVLPSSEQAELAVLNDKTITSTTTESKKEQRTQNFTFDEVFHEKTTRHVFEATTKPAIDALFDGKNSMVLAYGRTGSGKSYTMTGGAGADDDGGIVGMAVNEIFERKTEGVCHFLVRASVVEVYEDKFRDLGDPETSKPTNSTGVQQFVGSMKKTRFQTAKALQRWLKKTHSKRQAASTIGNKGKSSRGHLIVRIHLMRMNDGEMIESAVSATLDLIDLAGLEDATDCGENLDRQKESKTINTR
jgi:hypothetical protein